MNYKKVNIVEYVTNGINNGTLIPEVAVKYARVIARKGTLGESVTSWSVDGNGNEVVEKVAQVGMDQETGELDWILTKTDEFGDVLVDNNGHSNEWIVDDKTFNKKYELDPENEAIFKPKGGPQQFVQIPDNIILEQWGSEMQIAQGGYINITDVNDMYGISERDFNDTYKIVDGNILTK